MKHTLLRVLALSVALVPTTVWSGGLAEPLLEAEVVLAPEVIAAQTGSYGGFIVPLLILAFVAAAAAASSGGSSVAPPVVPIPK